MHAGNPGKAIGPALRKTARRKCGSRYVGIGTYVRILLCVGTDTRLFCIWMKNRGQ
jgi:hypothetical protein